jgi:hypothetical protein
VVSAELVTGVFSDGALTIDPPDAGQATGHATGQGIAVLAVVIRNNGPEPVLVDGCALAFLPDGGEVEIPDHFPGVNPELPCRLPAGNTLTMLTALKLVGVYIGGFQAAGSEVRSVHALVGLGTQQPVTSPGLDASTLVASP